MNSVPIAKTKYRLFNIRASKKTYVMLSIEYASPLYGDLEFLGHTISMMKWANVNTIIIIAFDSFNSRLTIAKEIFLKIDKQNMQTQHNLNSEQ